MISASKNIQLERARRIPDLETSVGATSYWGNGGETTFLFSVNIPFPLFDANQGNICRAKILHNRAEYIRNQDLFERKTKLKNLYEECQITQEEAFAMEKAILPISNDFYQMKQESYHEGKLDYLELLETQKSSLDLVEEKIEVFSRFHHCLIDLERLAGFNFRAPTS